MLCISRKPGEILIFRTEDGQEITVQNLGSHGMATKFGITADRSIRILRAEHVSTRTDHEKLGVRQ